MRRPSLASRLSVFAAISLVVFLGACSGASGDSPPEAGALGPDLALAPEGIVHLPQDEGIHSSDLEWWYFNGHLTAEGGQEFSFHFVTFRSALPSGMTPLVAQLSWTDHDEGLHITAEEASLPSLGPTSGEFDLSVADWRMSGNGDTYHLAFQAGDYAVDLELASQKPAVLHHRTGLVDLGDCGQDLLLLAHHSGSLRHRVPSPAFPIPSPASLGWTISGGTLPSGASAGIGSASI